MTGAVAAGAICRVCGTLLGQRLGVTAQSPIVAADRCRCQLPPSCKSQSLDFTVLDVTLDSVLTT